VPKIINVKYNQDNHDYSEETPMLVEFNQAEFVDLIKSRKSDVIFADKERFYIYEEGFCFYTLHDGYNKDFEDFCKVVKEMKELGVFRVKKFDQARKEAKILELDNLEEFLEFKNSDFYSANYSTDLDDFAQQYKENNLKLYKIYLKAKKEDS